MTHFQKRCSLKTVLKKLAIFFARKHMWWSLFLIKLWTLRPAMLLKRVFSCEYCKIFKSIYFQIICKRLLLPLEVFCIRNLLILAMRMLHLAAAYLFFNYNCIFAYEISFSDTRKLCSIYRSNQPLWKIHSIA